MPSPRPLNRRAALALGLAGVASALCGCGGGSSGRLKEQAYSIVSRTEIPAGGARRDDLLRQCARISRMGLPYRFGGESPTEGGFDCSGTIHYLLVSLGYRYPPRQSNHQYLWCEQQGTLARWRGGSPPRGMKPGDLIFWSNTYDTGKRYPEDISHVMVYMGRDRSGQFWQFGGRGRRARGEHGAGIDFHEFDPSRGPFGRGELAGWARIPGMRG